MCLLIGLSVSNAYHHINQSAHVAVKAEAHTLTLFDRIPAIIDKIAAPQIPVILHHFHVQSSAFSGFPSVFTFTFHVRDHDKLNGALLSHIQE